MLNGWLKVNVNFGYITTEVVDAIINPANENLIHSDGIAGEIMKRGGDEVQKHSDKWV